MNELIVNADGTTTVVGDAGSVSGILAELVEANTIPAECDEDGVVTKEAVVPDADTLAVEVTADELKTHAWRLPKARTEKLEVIRSDRNKKLKVLDLESGGDLVVGDDATLKSDSAVLGFGLHTDVTLTHVADTALLLNSSRRLQFGDSATYVHQSADAALDLVSDGSVNVTTGAAGVVRKG